MTKKWVQVINSEHNFWFINTFYFFFSNVQMYRDNIFINIALKKYISRLHNFQSPGWYLKCFSVCSSKTWRYSAWMTQNRYKQILTFERLLFGILALSITWPPYQSINQIRNWQFYFPDCLINKSTYCLHLPRAVYHDRLLYPFHPLMYSTGNSWIISLSIKYFYKPLILSLVKTDTDNRE